MQDHTDFYAAGSWQPSQSGTTVEVVNPYTEQVLGTAPEADAKDIDAAVAAAREAFDDTGWADSPDERADCLDRFADVLDRRTDEITRLISSEMGMPVSLCRQANVQYATSMIRYYAGLARDSRDPEHRERLFGLGSVVVHHRPYGVAALLAPWNYPLVLTANKLAPALASGCTAVVKPAPETSLSGLLLGELADEAGLPPGTVNIVTGGGTTGELLVRHQDVDTVAFTGSTATGRRIGAICGESLTPCSLELGGKSAAIVLPDADLDEVVAALAFLSFGNAGQTCFGMSRILVHRSRYAELVDRMAALADGQTLGDPLDEATTVGPVVSTRQRDSIEGMLSRAVTDGARVVAGGGRPGTQHRGYFVAPTVLADIDNSWEIAQQEVFGPVVALIPCAGEAEAVALANDSAYGLAGSVWTRDPDRGARLAERVHTGTFGINGYLPDFGAPFGGVKASGFSRDYGLEAMDAYRYTKTVFHPAAQEHAAHTNTHTNTDTKETRS